MGAKTVIIRADEHFRIEILLEMLPYFKAEPFKTLIKLASKKYTEHSENNLAALELIENWLESYVERSENSLKAVRAECREGYRAVWENVMTPEEIKGIVKENKRLQRRVKAAEIDLRRAQKLQSRFEKELVKWQQ
jgi:hypothetical protein